MAGASVPYGLLSVLLDYPTAELDEAAAELESTRDASLEPFLTWWHATPLRERQRVYVETFDLDPRTSLHLTYYLYGDTRKRGLALLRLKRLYAAAGLPLAADELPDYLPVILEFAASAPPGYGETVLGELRIGVELLRLRLHELSSPWASLLERLSSGLPHLASLERERVRRLLAEGPPGELVGLEPSAPPEVMPRAEARR